MIKKGFVILCAAVIFISIISAGCIDDADKIEITDEMYSELDELSSEMSALFAEIETEMLKASDEIAVSPKDSERSSKILSEILVKYPYLRNVIYKPVPGTNSVMGNPAPSAIINEDFVSEEMFSGKHAVLLKPILSESSGTISGMGVPVYSENGKYIGYISAWWLGSYVSLYNYDFFGDAGEYHISIQEDDIIVYDSIASLIGRNIKDTDKEFTYTSDKTGTYKQKSLNPVTLEKINIKGVWKKVYFNQGYITIYLGKTDQKIISELPEEYKKLTASEAENAVFRVYSYDRTHTKEQTLEYINSFGNLVGGVFNLYAFDREGNIIAASGDANKLVGKNEIDFIGAYGTKAIREIMIRGSQGFGYVSYYYQASVENYPDKSIPVIVFIIESDFGDYLTCSVIPMNPVVTKTDDSKFITVTDMQSSVREYYLENGYDALVSAVRNGYFGSEHISLLDYNGKIISSSNYPEITGFNTLVYKDDYGNSITRQAISMARLGGGYAVYARTIDDHETTFLYNIIPFNDEFMVISEVQLDTF